MSRRTFLVLQARPEIAAADQEYASILARGGLDASETLRLRLERDAIPPDLRLADLAGVIVGGGPGCFSDPPERKTPDEARIEAALLSLLPEICARDVPFLGCCYGIGALAHHLGAEVATRRWSESVSVASCALTAEGRADPLLAELPDRFDALVGHKEAVQALPPGCVHLVTSPTCRYQMIRHGRNVYATQFHPEADGEDFAGRVEIYRGAGYFPSAEAESLMVFARAQDVPWPPRILATFVARYRGNNRR